MLMPPTEAGVVTLVVCGGACLSSAAYLLGWFHAPFRIGVIPRTVGLLLVIWGPMLYLGWRRWPQPITLGFSLREVSPAQSVMFWPKTLAPGQALYRFDLSNNGRDISGLVISLDLPAIIVKGETRFINITGADNPNLKTELPPCTLMVDGKAEPLSGPDSSATIEISRLRYLGTVSIGFVTSAAGSGMLTVATAPDGSIVLTLAPAYGRYGAITVRYPRDGDKGKNEFHSYAVRNPIPDKELIDSTQELRPESRSILLGVTKEEVSAKNAGMQCTINYQDIEM